MSKHESVRTPTPSRKRPGRVTRVAIAAAAAVVLAVAWGFSTTAQRGSAAASNDAGARGASSSETPARAAVTASAKDTAPSRPSSREPAGARADGTPHRLRARVLASFPHDPTSYTQGLVWESDAFIESAGGYGDSLVRRWRPGAARPLAEEPLSDTIFAEGIAAVGDTLIQLSWREGIAFYRDRGTLRETARVSYEGEGWGLCYDGARLWMSDGSSLLVERDAETFLERRQVAVTAVRADGGATPVARLNELECVDGSVYANVYTTDTIARIDPASGRVTAMIDASGLLTERERAAGAEVLNGIAWNPERRTFYLTGKLWPRLFEVIFEPAQEDRAASP